MTKVLIVATSHKTRGGITSVINAHKKGKQWEEYHCKWIETHRDSGIIQKIWYLLRSLCIYFVLLPFYDIVHVHLSEPISAIRKCPFVWWAKLWGKKIIIHFHAFSPDTTIRSRWTNVYGYLFKNADIVIVLSEMWKNYVNEIFHLDSKVHVIYNPCTTKISVKQYLRKRQILYAGTINARKGYVDLINAFAMFAKQCPEWQIVFAGNGEIVQGKKLAERLNITNQVVFLGWISGTEKDKVFKESSIFCLPSYAEGFPMAILDAWSYGLPVITTPVGGIPDIAEDGKNLLLFNSGDVVMLAQQLIKMIFDENLRARISKESLRLAHTTFDIDVINHQICDVYKNLSK